jgi:mono/diheme cytochrome c family protein
LLVIVGCLAEPTYVPAETLYERGKYLMESIVACGDCHTPKTGKHKDIEFAGGSLFKGDGYQAYASNITSDRRTGIGGLSDRQIIKAIREGLRPDGSTFGPPMPVEHYRRLSDRDVWALVTYLRAVGPVRNEVAKSSYESPLPTAFGPFLESVRDVPRSDTVAYGGYLAGPAGRCIECHTPASPTGQRDFANRLGAGGVPFEGPWGKVVSANVTPDRETGIGAWSDSEIKTSITQGIRPNGTRLKGPMPFTYYARIAEEDLDAIVAYLRTLKPVANRIR